MAVAYSSDRVEPAVRRRKGSGLWRRLVIGGAPILAAVAVMVVGGTIASYVYETNRRGAVTLSNDLLDALDQRIAVQMSAYLRPAEQFLEATRAIGGERGVFDGALAAEPFVRATLGQVPQIGGFSYADPDGNFLYVVRNAAGGFDTKLVDRRSGSPHTTWTRRNSQGDLMATWEDATDAYDPRTRPWYIGADKEGHPFWTSAYHFVTLHKPGITYALPQYAANRRLVAVLGVDIELSALSTFLKTLHVGIHGKALVVDAKGRVIAYPSDDWGAVGEDGALLPLLDDLGDATLTRIYNRLKVEGFGRKVLDIDNQRVIVSSGALRQLTGRNWSVMIVAPESDFLGFVSSSGWLVIALSAVAVLLMVGLAGLMSWRSMLAERRDRMARERQHTLEARAQTLAELTAASTLMDRSRIDGVREATERAADTCRGTRVDVWYLSAAGRTLVCEDSYDRPGQAHTAGAELHRDEFPRLFAALETLATLDAPKADRDPRTAELAAIYLQPLGTTGVHIAPIHSGDRLLGMLKVEDPERGEGDAGLAEFCMALASLFALRYLPGSDKAAAPADAAVADPKQIAEQRVEQALGHRQTALQHRLLHYALSPAELAAGQAESAAVAVIRLPEWLAVARRADTGPATRMDAVVEEIERAVSRSAVGYAALFDDQVVLAAVGARTQADAAAVDARVVALAAIEVRDRLVDLTTGWGEGSEFRIAIDVGPVMASASGEGPRNLWGGAIGVAKVLAASGSRRAITVSEVAYQILAGDFLFRQRGTYFLPETGTMRTFVLVGAL